MKKILFIFTFLSFFIQTDTFATHIMGGDITYTSLGGNTYEVFSGIVTEFPWEVKKQ
jgi:hypothetical protein